MCSPPRHKLRLIYRAFRFTSGSGVARQPLRSTSRSFGSLLPTATSIGRIRARAGAPIGLYVAFYAGQKPGDSIHSPLNCLPGTGWEPEAVSTVSMARPDGSIGTARRMIVRKDDQQAFVLYWYQVHGRMLANEWVSKLHLLVDGVRMHRTDAALVRIVVPMAGSSEMAEAQAMSFARALIPPLDRVWSE